ncbi:MAG: AAA family ATPase, partial [Candidatus Micrarchaeota archaeon]
EQARLGDVNLKAPELYKEKSKDIAEVKEKIEKTSAEKQAILHMIEEIETKKTNIFINTFYVVNDNFKRLFNYIFKGEGTLILDNPALPFDGGLHIRVKRDIDKREKYLESLSGGEKSLLALLFIFSIQLYKPAPFYLLDEAEAALDKENSKKLAELLKKMSKETQFIVVSHNDAVISAADVALGVAMTDQGSKVVGIELVCRDMEKEKEEAAEMTA